MVRSELHLGPLPYTTTVIVPPNAAWIGTQFAAQAATLPAPDLTLSTALIARVGARH